MFKRITQIVMKVVRSGWSVSLRAKTITLSFTKKF